MLGVRKASRKAKGRSPSDPQQDAVYSWESSWGPWNHKTLTLEECRWWINEACKRFDVPTPHVQRHFTREYPYCNVTRRIISMSRKGMNAATCLHEASHMIAWDYFGDSIQDHGRTFMGIYLHLLEYAKIAPRIALTASARSHGIRWREMSPEICKGS